MFALTLYTFCLGLAAAASYDLWTRRVPNWIVFPLLILGLVLNGFAAGPAAFAKSLGGVLVGGGILWFPFVRGWLGGGDVKFLAAIGAWIGPQAVFQCAMAGAILGGGLALAVALYHRDLGREVVDNLFATVLTRQLPEPVKRARPRSVPFAVALAIAGYAVAVYAGALPHA